MSIDNNFDNFIDILPNEAIPVTGLRILFYLGEDGASRYRFAWSGDGSSTEIIGLLELVKAELISQSLRYGGAKD